VVTLLVARVRKAAFFKLFISHGFEVNELTHIFVVSIIEAASGSTTSLGEETLLS
jgi:hypothetical protein